MYQDNNHNQNHQHYRSKQSTIRLQKTQYDLDEPKYVSHRGLKQNNQLYHSYMEDPQEVLIRQCRELQGALKQKEQEIDELNHQLYQTKSSEEQIKSYYQDEIQHLQMALDQQLCQIKQSNSRFQETQQLLIQSQQENAKHKLLLAKLKEQMIQIQDDNRRLKEQLDQTTNITQCDNKQDDEVLEPNSQSLSLIANIRKDSHELGSSFQLQQLHIELSKSKQQIQEKNKLILTLNQQIFNLTQLQEKLTRSPQVKAMPTEQETPQIRLPSDQSTHSQFNQSQLLNCRSQPRFSCNQSPGLMNKSALTIKSQVSFKNRSEVKELYSKISQSTNYMAGLCSTMMDYRFLNQTFKCSQLDANRNAQL